MNTSFRCNALRSVAFIGLAAGLAPAAFAQAQTETQGGTTASTATAAAGQQDPTAPPAQTADDSDQGKAIVVTGSRIRRPNLDSPVPVTTLQGEEFFQTGSTSVGDVLNELPSLTSTFSQSNSTRF